MPRLADRRGAGAEHVPLDELSGGALPIDAQAERLLAIDAALTRLDALDPRLAKVVELRFFAGMEVADLADQPSGDGDDDGRLDRIGQCRRVGSDG